MAKGLHHQKQSAKLDLYRVQAHKDLFILGLTWVDTVATALNINGWKLSNDGMVFNLGI